MRAFLTRGKRLISIVKKKKKKKILRTKGPAVTDMRKIFCNNSLKQHYTHMIAKLDKEHARVAIERLERGNSVLISIYLNDNHLAILLVRRSQMQKNESVFQSLKQKRQKKIKCHDCGDEDTRD